MANLFVDLPMPVMNGPGAAVDTSSMGAQKTIVVVGDFEGCVVTVEASVDGGTEYASVLQLQGGASKTVITNVAAEWMRVSVSGRKTTVPFSCDVDVGAPDTGVGNFTDIPMPAGNGTGTPVDVSAFGAFATFVLAGAIAPAVVTIEASEDGIQYAPVITFGQAGLSNLLITQKWVRANVTGRRAPVPFTGTLAMGAVIVTGGGGSGSGPAISAGSQIATNGTVLFGNSNGLTFGMSGSSLVTGTFDAIKSLFAGTTRITNGEVVFLNSNGVSFGADGQTITASVAGASAGLAALSAGTTLASTGTIVFSNSNGMSFGMNAGTVTGSFGSVIAASAAGSSISNGIIVWSNSNNVSFGMAGRTITASATFAQSAQPAPAAISAGTASASSGTIVFSNSNNFSFGMAGNTVTASFNATQSTAPSAISAGTTLASAGTIVFSNSNNLTFGMNAGTVTASYLSINVKTLAFANPTNTGTQTNTLGLSDNGTFSNSNGFSWGLSNRTITLRGLATASMMQDPAQFATRNVMSQAALSLYRHASPFFATLTQMNMVWQNNFLTVGVTDTVSVSFGWYTISGSTASLASSASQTVTIDLNDPSNVSKAGLVGITGFTHNITPGDYLLGIWMRNSTTLLNTVSVYGALPVPIAGVFGAGAAATQQFINGYSSSSFTTGMPASIHVSNASYVRSDSLAYRQPSWQFLGT